MKNGYKLFVIYLFTTFSCTEVIPVDFQEHEPLLVINSVLSPDDPFWVQVSASKSLNDNSHFPMVENAIVTIFKNGTVLEVLQNQGEGIYSSEELFPLPGNNYAIEVSAPGFPNASAECKMPKTPDLLVNAVENYHSGSVLFKLTIKDAKDLDPYYSVRIYHVRKGRSNEEEYVKDYRGGDYDFFEMIYEYGLSDNYLLEAIVFNENDFDLNFKFSHYERQKFYVELAQVTPDYFHYCKTKNYNSNISEHFLSQLKKTPNNIKGGFGLFAGISFTTFEFELLFE